MGFTKVLTVHVETKEFVTAINCDKCGKEATLTGRPSDHLDGVAPAGFHWLKVSGGYSSDFPQDGDVLDILICDGCLKEWVTSFKTAPHNASYIFDNPIRVDLHGPSAFSPDRTMWLKHNVLETNQFQTTKDLDEVPEETPDARIDDCYNDRTAESLGDEKLIQIYQTAMIRSTGRHAVIYRLMNRDASEFHALDIDDWFQQYKFLTPESL
jgi:hypothetical protein